jgi:hypothetical protein
MNHAADARPLVLVCPLNWGLGHATRCVPVIRELLKRSCRVMVLADGAPMVFLQEYFGDKLEYRVLPGKRVSYPSGRGMVCAMLRQLPGFIWSVWNEHRRVKGIIRETGAAFLVSDNRYGLFHNKLKCVFITHQLFISVPRSLAWAGRVLHGINHWFIRKYDVCWVPDFSGEDNLSGRLSHKNPVPGVRFVGPLSRFAEAGRHEGENPLPAGFPSAFCLVILSGPEPQRSILEEKLLAGFKRTGGAVVFVRGLPGEKEKTVKSISDQMVCMNHAADKHLIWLIRHSRLVICRPGYSGIMDLAVFGKKALVIPTPGQTEQEYLADRMVRLGWVACSSQHELAPESDMLLAEAAGGIPRQGNAGNLLGRAIDELLGA